MRIPEAPGLFCLERNNGFLVAIRTMDKRRITIDPEEDKVWTKLSGS
ncbi:MAG: hypothetical protein GX295_02110 [Syntrophomonadaceae bacterium]|nr:hypothetical protein [Syntrophomonadaceae bacterium]